MSFFRGRTEKVGGSPIPAGSWSPRTPSVTEGTQSGTTIEFRVLTNKSRAILSRGIQTETTTTRRSYENDGFLISTSETVFTGVPRLLDWDRLLGGGDSSQQERVQAALPAGRCQQAAGLLWETQSCR